VAVSFIGGGRKSLKDLYTKGVVLMAKQNAPVYVLYQDERFMCVNLMVHNSI
jgi:hypothetical protein